MSKGYALSPKSIDAPALAAKDAAARLGISVQQLEALARSWWLEPTYSMGEVATHFGLSKHVVGELVRYGVRYGKGLHPSRGGLWPTFKPSWKSRRIPLSATERHKWHMSRAHDGVAVD